MKLQRYELGLFWDGNENIPALLCEPDGECVKHSEALDWFESLLDRPIPDHYDWSERETVTTERDRLRAILAAERNKV